MSRTVNKEHSIQLQHLLTLIGTAREPFTETGRKFDKIYVENKVRYFVARFDIGEQIKAGDVFGAKSKLAPNFRWYFGNLENVDKWEWSGFHGVPVSDTSVKQVKGYGKYTHYTKVS